MPTVANRSQRRMRCCLAFFCLIASSHAAWAQVIVHKTPEPFDSVTWKLSDDSTAGGDVQSSASVPSSPDISGKHSVTLNADFSGKGFEFFLGMPLRPLVLPGVTKSLSLWVRSASKRGWTLQFKDGWGRGEVAGKKLEWNLTDGADGTWKQRTFSVPSDWVQPLSVQGIVTHNWDKQTEKSRVSLSLAQLQVTADIADVDAATGVLKTWKPAAPNTGPNLFQKAPVTPLRSVTLQGTERHNVFSGVRPQFQITALNWQAQTAAGTLQWKVFDSGGGMPQSGSQPFRVHDNFALSLPLNTLQYGIYRLEMTLLWANGEKTVYSQPYAVIPVARELTDVEKDGSPYGLNVLSARQSMVATFRKAGIVWFRDYGFNYEWMVRAKGDDNKYAGWPYYPKILREYEANGARVLANLQTSIRPPATGVPPGPDHTWIREITGILMAFPSLRAFELDNEYDLNAAHTKAEEAVNWKNYGLYHRKFGDVARLLGAEPFLAVENGRAGIWPERLRRMVQSGDFASIDVVNSHHYAGADPPEFNSINHNMGFSGDEKVMTLYDQLRAAKQAGSSDGKPRQHWLTEFGWDTKAGPVVSPVEQAAYLARAFMLLSAAGTAKGFWYWDLDSAEANQFFDGCGLFTSDQMPKLSYAAYAGLTQILPKPEYIGTINAGENTWGYLFRNEGKLVSALWTLDGKPGPTVDFETAIVYDYLANPLPKSAVALGITPVYAVGVTENSRWFRQAAYRLETPYLVSATSGDVVSATLTITNRRQTAIHSHIRLQLPPAWADLSGETNLMVPPGRSANVALKFRIATQEPYGEQQVHLLVREGEPLQTIPVRVLTQRPIAMTVTSLKGAPGESEVDVRLSNHSTQPRSGTLHFKLPGSWSTPTPSIAVNGIQPMEIRHVRATVRWTSQWNEGEFASVEFQTADAGVEHQPLIPSYLTLYHVSDLKMDGDLRDWPSKTKVPDWVLGSTSGTSDTAAYLAWSEKGLYIALEVHHSKASVPDPRNFWTGDVLELFLDAHDNKILRKYEPGDHQFWLAPLVDKKRVYVGQWKRNEEIPQIRYDLSGIQSMAVRKNDGYVLECLLPATQIQGFKPRAGTRLGLNLNLSVRGDKQDREVFWSLRKSEGADQPALWGTVTLAD